MINSPLENVKAGTGRNVKNIMFSFEAVWMVSGILKQTDIKTWMQVVSQRKEVLRLILRDASLEVQGKREG